MWGIFYLGTCFAKMLGFFFETDIMIDNRFNQKLEDIFVLNPENGYETEIAQQCFNIVDVLIVAIDLNGKVTLVNEKAVEILEYEKGELIGKDWFKDVVLDINAQEKGRFKDFLEIQPPNPKKKQFLVKTKNGKERIIEAKSLIMNNKSGELLGVLISGEDITKYLKIQDQLQSTIDQYRRLAGSIPDINMYLFDKDLQFIIAEGSEMRAEGMFPYDFEGKTANEVFDHDLKRIVLPLYRSALEGREISTEYVYKNNNYMIWAIPIKDPYGKVYAGMSITQNVTREKEASARLKVSKEEAEKANKTKSEFLANISHEIRTPLNAIVGFTEQLLKKSLGKEQEEFAKIIEKSADHLLSLVNELLILSKLEAGRVSFDETPFNIEFIVQEVCNSIKIKASEKKIGFKCDIDPGLHRVYLGDYTRLRQVLYNMISNAIKFTDEGHVEVRCNKYGHEGDMVMIRFDIIDTGIGISKDKIDEIFDHFKQADSTITRKYGGTGLGLSICKRIVELQGGEIMVKSEKGLGSQFTFIVPYKKIAESDLKIAMNHEIDKNVLKGLKVLIADDDSVNRLLGKTIANNLNCDVDLANDGNETIEKIKDQKYDIILLDIHMPGRSGIEVAHYMRNTLNDTSTKIIAVTADVIKEQVGEYFKAGMDDYLIKPYKELELFNKMLKVLKGQLPEMAETKTNIVFKVEKEQKYFNLDDLRAIANYDNDFILKMLETFMHNAADSVKQMESHMEAGLWKNVGEAAHKVLPSFRHLEANALVALLTRIKEACIVDPDYGSVPNLVNEYKMGANQLIMELNKEMGKM
jgi:PAS domain S-box-containing protein